MRKASPDERVGLLLFFVFFPFDDNSYKFPLLFFYCMPTVSYYSNDLMAVLVMSKES